LFSWTGRQQMQEGRERAVCHSAHSLWMYAIVDMDPAGSLTFLGIELRRRRQARGLTQAQLASRVRLSRAVVIRAEKGDPTIAICKSRSCYGLSGRAWTPERVVTRRSRKKKYCSPTTDADSGSTGRPTSFTAHPVYACLAGKL